ncbi:Ribose 5-phosphate isomerase B [hydrothermal vent metagenome]|uniref:Ribose 5-phosphate isomerase B n=1 Tax=hydrothermal vent metagenome TaxID=652676 RepID=A0A3B1C680_9ZZZZ
MGEGKIAVASDHGAFEMKGHIIERLKELGYDPVDMGVYNEESVDYPDYGIKVAEAVSSGKYKRGILLCGTGIGMSITANKFPGIRAALVHDNYTARMSRQHNDSNILALGGRTTGVNVAYDILETWLNTEYEGGRHDRRLEKISKLEKKYTGANIL